MTDEVESTSSSDKSKVSCPVCQELIFDGARKCIHCDSFLDWHGWLSISQATLALLVALISVVASSAPRLGEFFSRDHSDLQVNIRQILAQRMELTASNRGNKAGQLLSAAALSALALHLALALSLAQSRVRTHPPLRTSMELPLRPVRYT